jgi:hypothetical protein
VFADSSGFSQFEYRGHRIAVELHQKIVEMGLQPRMGRYGEFYTLPSVLTVGDEM